MKTSLKRRQLCLATAAWCGGCAGAAGPAAAAPPAEGDAAQSFRALRKLRGHFDGGTWSDDLDRWQGRKHVAMQRLAQHMLRERAPAAQLRRVMGEPDGMLQPGQAAHARALAEGQWQSGSAGTPSAAGNTAALWLYRWRGTHDQLAFALDHDLVVASGWLHQWE